MKTKVIFLIACTLFINTINLQPVVPENHLSESHERLPTPIPVPETDSLREFFEELYNAPDAKKLVYKIMQHQDKKEKQYLLDLIYDATNITVLPQETPKCFEFDEDTKEKIISRLIQEVEKPDSILLQLWIRHIDLINY